MPLNFHIKYIRVFFGLLILSGCNDDHTLPDQSQREKKPDKKQPLTPLKLNTSSKLNDTGITWRGLFPKGIDDTCMPDASTDAMTNAKHANQQDCYTGRDVFLHDDSNGAAGFSYTKIDKNGQKLPNNADTWQCVVDNVSGFMWEIKTNTAGLHNATDKFTWYNANKKTNGGKIGDWNNNGKHCYGYEEGKPKTYCHTEQFVSRVNKQGLCGFHDWRLPTRTELTSLIHFGRTEPAIDTHFFPHTQHDFYWSNSPTATRKLEAWTVSFEYGFTTPMRRTDTRYARLVRTFQQPENHKEPIKNNNVNQKNNAL